MVLSGSEARRLEEVTLAGGDCITSFGFGIRFEKSHRLDCGLPPCPIRSADVSSASMAYGYRPIAFNMASFGGMVVVKAANWANAWWARTVLPSATGIPASAARSINAVSSAP